MSHNKNAKFAFWYLLSLVALICMAIGTGQVLFQVINKLIPDFPGYYSGMFDAGTLKFGISLLIISIPLYFIVSRQIEHNLVSGELDKESPIRRWLTYGILFISSVVMIFWLVYTIHSFLGGDLTSKFLLKAATVIVIAGLTFSYYFLESRRDKIRKNDPMIMAYLIAALIITIGSLVTAFFFIEKPSQSRGRRIDQQTLGNFAQINGAINTYYNQNKELPKSLDQLNKNNAYYLSPDIIKDPESGKPYDYKPGEKGNYELCADFRTSNKDDQMDYQREYGYGYGNWQHDAGYQCSPSQATILTDIDKSVIPPAVQ